MTPVGFEATISAGERPKTYALDRTATGTGCTRTAHVPRFNLGLMTSHRYGGVQFFFYSGLQANFWAVSQVGHGVFLHNVFKLFLPIMATFDII
jgi:hypothetical protein